jgi:lysophospholipase L1-like esterase
MYSLLSLGDSYTIGEGVPLADSYPYQTVQLLRRNGHVFHAPEIIAQTGWTTDELAAAMDRTLLLPLYDLATLLIGVNNQYQDRDPGEYGRQFEDLLLRAGRLASGRVIVLSIPDWGVSPFAASTNRAPADIARGIDAFNAIAGDITRSHGLPFIDITPHSRTSPVFTTDGLHPAAETYAYWAQQLAANIAATLS